MTRQLVLVRYLIPTIFIDTWIWFDTRYSILDTFVVNVISSTYSGATWNDCAMSIYYFSKKNCYETLWGKRNPEFFLENPIFSLENPIFLSKIQFFLSKIRIFLLKIRYFFLEHSNLFRKHTKFGGLSLTIYYFSKTRNPVFGHFPSFPASSFMLA